MYVGVFVKLSQNRGEALFVGGFLSSYPQGLFALGGRLGLLSACRSVLLDASLGLRLCQLPWLMLAQAFGPRAVVHLSVAGRWRYAPCAWCPASGRFLEWGLCRSDCHGPCPHHVVVCDCRRLVCCQRPSSQLSSIACGLGVVIVGRALHTASRSGILSVCPVVRTDSRGPLSGWASAHGHACVVFGRLLVQHLV